MSAVPGRAWIGLGGNVGDVRHTLAQALGELDALPGTRVLRRSACFRSPAWGPVAQPDFVNAVCELATELAPEPLMRALLACERRHGRDRDHPLAQRWGPRTLDLDLLLYGELVQDSGLLTLPHPRLHERAFVLLPLASIEPGLEVPGRGRVDQLLSGLVVEGVEAIP